MNLKKNSYITMQVRQQGFLILLAIFMLVVMSLFAVTLSRTISRAHLSTTQFMMSTVAFNAAESGLEFALQQLLFDYNDGSELSQSDIDTNCSSLSKNISFAEQGLSNCTGEIECKSDDFDGITSETGDEFFENETYIYTIDSIATCGSGDIIAKRALSVTGIFKPFYDLSSSSGVAIYHNKAFEYRGHDRVLLWQDRFYH